MLSLFVKSSTADSMPREALLGWICLGLLELSLANYAQTGGEGPIAKPLFGRIECFPKDIQRFLLQSEACFMKALEICKHLPPGNDQLTALAWFSMGCVLAMGRGWSFPLVTKDFCVIIQALNIFLFADLAVRQSAYCFAMSFSLCNQVSYFPHQITQKRQNTRSP